MASNLPPVPDGLPERDEWSADETVVRQTPAHSTTAYAYSPENDEYYDIDLEDDGDDNDSKPKHDKKRKHAAKKGHPFLWGLLGGFVGVVLLGGVGCVIMNNLVTDAVTNASGSSTVSTSAGNVVNITSSTEDASTAEVVAAKCLPSVVSISVESSSSSGVGSGVVLDTDGNILTNYHVVEGAQTIVVNMNNSNYDATVVGYDQSSDLAVVRINADASDLTPMEIGDSDSLVVGEWVMSLGSPFGFDQSVTQGIVSSMYRSTILSDSSGNTIYTNLIQTDAAINPGNSGGALVNASGQLIGINSLIESTSGSSSGVGFAIPVNYAIKVADTIIAGKTVEHAYIGASIRTVTPEFASAYRLGVDTGAYIETVTEGSPAAQAGLEQGDVVTEFDGETIASADGLILAIRSHDVGDTAELTYVRGSKEYTITVTLGSDGTDTAVASNSGRAR